MLVFWAHPAGLQTDWFARVRQGEGRAVMRGEKGGAPWVGPFEGFGTRPADGPRTRRFSALKRRPSKSLALGDRYPLTES